MSEVPRNVPPGSAKSAAASSATQHSATQRVTVQLAERSYDIEIGTGNLATAGDLLANKKLSGGRAASRAILITDSHVGRIFASRLVESLAAANVATGLITVPAGEASKSAEQVTSLWEQMLALGADRTTVVVALGGGVIGDLAGFAAASFARGIPLLQVPTSLLAQVDSSVGGKVGINLPGAKNMVGAFWQPLGVVIDTEVLSTLPEREYLSGLAEVVKYGVILDEAFFAYLEANREPLRGRDAAVLREVVARCCRLKAQVVEQDEREETGVRAVLNYGHTFAHAIESATGYGTLLHGEAVSIGMQCAARLAERLGRIGADVTHRQREQLLALGLPIDVPSVPHDRLVELMANDKKVAHGRLRFVLPSRLGHVELVDDVGEADVRAALIE